MVHTRINERSTNPNPYINFISPLPSGRNSSNSNDPEATELMRALAAQLKPVMKAHGFTVNSFEEYESNKVFLGRNWNNGETVELVLRDGSGRFYPISMLLSVFCHELAHIKHMNHSTAFHTLRRQLSAEVAAQQRKGYYGDGYWSAGTRLADSQRISGDAQSVQELPEYTCGGAHAQSRSSVLPSRRRRRVRVGPSLSTGAQTTKRRKAGSRVTQSVFEGAGGGSVLDERVEKGGKGSGFGKQAGSRRAREERALAAERRLLQMQGKLVPEPQAAPAQQGEGSADSGSDGEGDSFDERCASETDVERLKMMRDLMGGEDLGALKDEDDDDVVVVSDTSRTFTDPSGGRGTRFGPGHANGQQIGLKDVDDDDDDVVLVSDASRTFTNPSGGRGTRPGLGRASGQQIAGPSRTMPSPSIVNTGGADVSPSSHGSSHTRLEERTRSHADGEESRPAHRAKRRLGCGPGLAYGEDGPASGPSGEKRRFVDGAMASTVEGSSGSTAQSLASGAGMGAMVDAEMRQRKREALGMDRGRKLGSRLDGIAGTASHQTSSPTRAMRGDASQPVSGNVNYRWTCSRCTFVNHTDQAACAMCDGSRQWACLRCTFENGSGERCEMCDSPRA